MFVGVDLVKISRWERILEKFPRRAEKIFTEEEIAHCEKKGKKRAESYAALWGAPLLDTLGKHISPFFQLLHHMVRVILHRNGLGAADASPRRDVRQAGRRAWHYGDVDLYFT